MKKYLIYVSLFLALVVACIRCSKTNTDNNVKNNKVAVTKQEFFNHLISSNDAKIMISMYDEHIGSSIENKFKNNNKDYISPTTVTYNIDTLIAYLNYLKEKGSAKVHIRFGAINGDGKNGRIPGLPYHSLLFYGNLLSNNNLSDSITENLYFDHGELCPHANGCN